jgi:hypothetical protein
MINLNDNILNIDKEVKSLNKYKKNLKLFIYSQTISGKIRKIDFDRFISEIERITLEINNLENTKTYLIKINEQL